MIHERLIITLLASLLFVGLMFSGGCKTAELAVKSASNKNIATGSDTWGGKIIAEFFGEGWMPNVTLTFGRTRQWYVSLRDMDSAKELAGVVTASNSTLSIEAKKTGVIVSNEAK